MTFTEVVSFLIEKRYVIAKEVRLKQSFLIKKRVVIAKEARLKQSFELEYLTIILLRTPQ
jgi:hypothetical protein